MWLLCDDRSVRSGLWWVLSFVKFVLGLVGFFLWLNFFLSFPFFNRVPSYVESGLVLVLFLCLLCLLLINVVYGFRVCFRLVVDVRKGAQLACASWPPLAPFQRLWCRRWRSAPPVMSRQACWSGLRSGWSTYIMPACLSAWRSICEVGYIRHASRMPVSSEVILLSFRGSCLGWFAW